MTLLAHQVDAVLPALVRSRAACVHFMFNNFDPERLRDQMGEARCSFGMPFVMAHLEADGSLDGKTSPGQKCLHSDPRWVEVFDAAGLPSALEPNMLSWLRCHVPLGSSFESICVAAQRRGEGASWSEAMVVARGMHAGFALVKAQGHRLDPSGKSMLAALPAFLVAALLWSVSRIRSFRELLATGAGECRALVDVMLKAAADANVPSAAISAMSPPE